MRPMTGEGDDTLVSVQDEPRRLTVPDMLLPVSIDRQSVSRTDVSLTDTRVHDVFEQRKKCGERCWAGRHI
jgi:hypothetical protein